VAGLSVDHPLTWPKGSTWLLEGIDGQFRFGRYLPPLSLADALRLPLAPDRLRARGRSPGTGP
jgi:hypothetical protein